MYGEFAQVYDELMNDFDYGSWYEYIEDILIKYNRKPKNILEMACGTGNLSEKLAENGYKLTCFDLSEDMLVMADGKLNKYKNVRLLKQNMVDFDLGEKYELILSVCDSINYILKEDDLYRSFKNVYDHLEDGGLFVFDINSHYKLTEIIGNNTFVEDRENIFYTWENYYDREEEIVEFYLTFFVSEDGENFQRFNEDHIEKAWRKEEIIGLLKKAGFISVDCLEAFTFKEAETKTERLNFIVRK